MQGEPLYTVQEVAERLRLNPETVRVWLRAGKIKGVLIGGRKSGYRIPESEVARLLNPGIAQDLQEPTRQPP
jgi:excisionase family DNA binding protein